MNTRLRELILGYTFPLSVTAGLNSQEDIYNDFFATLDEAIPVLEQNRGENVFGSNDLVFDGNAYEGMRNGLPRSQKTPELNTNYSDMGQNWLNNSRGGINPPLAVMRAAEIYFLRAEGALMNWNMGGFAEQLYDEGVRMSLSEERIGASSEQIEA